MGQKKKKSENNSNEIALNKRARFEYEILESLETGIILSGTEVKSLRRRQVNLSDSFARVKDGEIFAINIVINPYSHGNIFNHDPTRERKLLLHKSEIEKIGIRVREKGLTLVPLKMYFNDKGKAKVLLGICRGKQSHDKREVIKERESKREMERAIKRYSQ